MDNTTSDGGDPSGTDRPNWTPLDDDLAELNERLNTLECQNGQMYSMLEEEVVIITDLYKDRRPCTLFFSVESEMFEKLRIVAQLGTDNIDK